MLVIGRDREKAILQDCLDSKESEFVAIYGRRRVGKTFLVREFYKKLIAFEFVGAYQIDMHGQLDNFYRAFLNQAKNIPELERPKSWFDAFDMLSSYLESLDKKRKWVVFLDELPWMNTPRSKFLTALGYLWNSRLSHLKNIILVVSGSAASWLKQNIINNTGGLYNRVTKRIILEPFTLNETEGYLKEKNIQLTRYQIVQIYMVMGGIPHYLKEIKRGRSAVQEIDRICFQKGGLLRDEFDLIYVSLFGKDSNHQEIVAALANKPNGLTRNGIIASTNITSGGSINRSLVDLEECGFIQTTYPFENKKKESLYRLTDFYSHFYIKFMKGSRSREIGSFKLLSRSPSWRAWSGYAFENICHLHINEIKMALGISGIYSTISSWKYSGDEYRDGVQIDLLIDRSDQVINLCEVKYSENEYTINKSYGDKLRKRRATFIEITKTRKACFATLITTFGCVQNQHFLGQVQSQVVLDQLF